MAKELLTAHSVRAITNAGVYKDGGGLRLIVTVTSTSRSLAPLAPHQASGVTLVRDGGSHTKSHRRPKRPRRLETFPGSGGDSP